MKRITVLIFMCAVLLSGCTHDRSAVYSMEEETAGEAYPADSSPEEENSCCVYVCGAVVNPGVYMLPEGSRVCDAIEAAGGFAEGADETSINQAKHIKDEMQLRVYFADEDVQMQARININSADKETLMTLPGIGEAKADAIIAYREKTGGFSSAEELMNVEGIAEKLYSGLAELIET